ncbi:hypothetical protein BDV40DRAFT_168375 [Aspergillus tamarii]|uniref:Uncharacterized protein n=1 Tax=Aspergillus tamarii TaxID=41984 RepID=A0A5N6V8Z9_ASPTM|nr:hypothetical protein BDV40DRAFT_168375 [Aspergillus tamarii]
MVDPLSIWTLDWMSAVKLDKPFLECQEALTLSSILFLQNKEDQRPLISSHFPNERSIRYPSVSLDDRFVAYANKDSTNARKRATHALRTFIKVVPTRLLREVTIYLLDNAADHSPKPTLYRTILTGMAECHCPLRAFRSIGTSC